MKADLHVHTTYSDGKLSPAAVIARAAAIGLDVIAITDHDNANGAREAIPLAHEAGIDLIPAIEFTCCWDGYYFQNWGGDIDVLGYGMDLNHPHLLEAEKAALEDIHDRITECCLRLTAAGYPITMGDVFAENPNYGGAIQTADALVHKGYASTYHAALDIFIQQWRKVRTCSILIEQHIATIHAAGGVAVLAHPTLIQTKGGGWIKEEQIAELIGLGLDGLEIYHPRLTQPARDYFLKMAQQFDLLVTGGSDEHGFDPSLPGLGQQPITRELINTLRASFKG
jgi:predicted metal-dependent phosphoesterase TrpH